MNIRCPKCGKPAKWEGNKWRPFCSERCKALDLGAWASEDYKVAGEESIDENDTKDAKDANTNDDALH